LPLWRAAQPRIDLEIIGTDDVIDLHAGGADVAIRYARAPPPLTIFELCRDRYWPVCSAKLLARGRPILSSADLAHYPLIHAVWPEWQIQPPTWQQWLAVARSTDRGAVAVDALAGPSFREELHAIDAVIAGQGIGVVSDVLAARELATGELVKVLDLSLPGFGFYVAHIADHPRRKIIDAFTSWLRSVA
jgi:LysR family glycine cleavage system transcriptional activator